jgi:hypothetical protein
VTGGGAEITRVFKNAWFWKFARKEKISDAALCEAVARLGAGKSGGYRTLIFFRAETRAVFAFGFAKSDRANLDEDEEAAFKKAARLVLSFSEKQLDAELESGRLTEVDCDGQDIQE